MKFLVPPFFKDFFLQIGLYRQFRDLYRSFFNTNSAKAYKEALEFYGKLLPSGCLCFDVGAHIGEKTEIFLQLGKRVVAFEPQPQCVKEINLRCKHSKERLQVLQKVLGCHSGITNLYLSPISNKSSLDPNWLSVSKESILVVEVITLDEAISIFGEPWYCKIDVEGHELDVLKGLTNSIHLISFEYHLWEKEISKSIACLQYIFNIFGDIEINITPSEKLEFYFEEWISLDTFLNIFPNFIINNYDYRYGDIFVRKI
jgi:FkbM family methyltransferase